MTVHDEGCGKIYSYMVADIVGVAVAGWDWDWQFGVCSCSSF